MHKEFLCFPSYLDFINLMAYDFHGKWEKQAGHNAPLYAPSSDSEWRKQLSVDHAAHLWVKLGAPKEKLIIGKLNSRLCLVSESPRPRAMSTLCLLAQMGIATSI